MEITPDLSNSETKKKQSSSLDPMRFADIFPLLSSLCNSVELAITNIYIRFELEKLFSCIFF